MNVSETAVLGLSAAWRAITLLAGGISTLPLRAIQERDGITTRVASWMDNPAGGLTRLELVETVVAQMALHGNAFLAHIYGGAGQLVSVQPIHPSAVAIDVDKAGNKSYRVSLNDGTTQLFTDATMTHIKWLSLDGIRGLSPLQLARNGAFGTGLAADRSAASQFGSGMRASALATFEDETTEDDARIIQQGLDKALTGEANAGRIALINRKVSIHPWQLSNEDAQWLQSREFQVEEIARIYGIPATLIGLSDRQSSWGTGIREMHLAMSRWSFMPFTSRIEQRLSLLLPPLVKAEFDYRDLLAPDPATEVNLLIAQVQAGLLSTDEARQILNRAPLPKSEIPEPAEQEPAA